MSKLEKMRERLNNLKDPELLEVAKELLTEMAEIQRLREQIELREEGLTEGKRAAFYFFAQGLDPEELAHAASTAQGRIRFLRDKEEREKAAALRDGETTEDAETTDDSSVEGLSEKISKNSTFGGLGSSFGS